ncbi:MAG: serine/threonine-protein kinase [Pyrinomonadaceae bacterium]
MFKENDTIGHYRLDRFLGRGSFGIVWLATRTTNVHSTKVAIKIPIDDGLDIDAFKNEAVLWSVASGHPNVLPIIEADIIDGQPFIVSEYADNGSLLDWMISLDDDIPVRRVVEIVTHVLKGLVFLHEKGIVHRDLKPENIMLQSDVPRLCDFGISRLYSSTTRSRGVAGTPLYMAPESFDGVRSSQSDIWAVGVLLYELLNQEHPFKTGDYPVLLKSIFFDEPRPSRRNIPIGLQSILSRALDKDPNSRFESAFEMLEEFQSNLVKFELTMEPEGRVPRPESFGVEPTSIDYQRNPRLQHYSFAHRFLRDKAFSYPGPLLADLARPTAAKYLSVFWVSNATDTCGPNDQLIPPDGLSCKAFTLERGYAGAIVKLPDPAAPSEAFFVAIIMPDAEIFGSDARVRFLTLESSPCRSNGTIIGEWIGEDMHKNYGPGPVPTFQNFYELVDNILS